MKKTIQLKGIDPMLFAGAHDCNMKIIENSFKSQIILRGSSLFVDGYIFKYFLY